MRQFETPGYGWENGPGNQRSDICTGMSDANGTKRSGSSGVPVSTSRQTSTTLSDIRLAPYSACA